MLLVTKKDVGGTIMKNKISTYLYSFILVMFVLIGNFNPQATIFGAEEDLTYTISVVPTENQINKNATYYDLLVKPNQKQSLTVVVSNTGDSTKNIRVTPTNAITNQNGVIDYSRQEKKYQYDPNLAVSFTSLIGPEQIVEVGPKESKEVTFDLSVPGEPFEGLILGGFLADLPDEKTDDDAVTGVKIVNKFQLVKAVMLRENEEKVTPKLELNEVKANLVAYRTAVTANLQNTQPTMFGKLKVNAQITEKGKSEVIKRQVMEDMEMAPYSNFDFPIMWENQRLEPGNYTLNLVATSGEEEWKFYRDFTITAKESESLNNEAVDLAKQEKNYTLYLIIAAIVLIIVIIIVVIWLIYRNKKGKSDKKKRRKNTSKKHR